MVIADVTMRIPLRGNGFRNAIHDANSAATRAVPNFRISAVRVGDFR